MAGFKNAKRASRRLRAIPPGVRKQVRTQLRSNAVELVASQRSFAPVEDGDLKASIQFEDTSDANRIAMTVTAGGAATTRPVREGQTATYDYALGQEFGTEDMPANPFFFPPYRAKRKTFKRKRNKAAKDAIGKAVTKP